MLYNSYAECKSIVHEGNREKKQMNIFDNLPESIIRNVVQEKISGRTDRYSEYCKQLSSFRNYIVQELKQISLLFSEYTPHDEDNHIANLFHIADKLLGKEAYERMNAVELCLLMGAMYAHDWGMAVSRAERYYIATGKKQDGSPEIKLLDDEFDRFEQFIKKRTGKAKFESDEEIDTSLWQEYVRNTHALRSGKRVREYFAQFNGGVAGALEKICVGHWLDIEDISERNGYYKDASVFGENVNLKALTIYIRLIDLFDLAEDRTPYVLWKFVNPQNHYSKLEWEKHRALHQITCSKYEKGRVICISGSTDNHEVYAALMDFKKLCERYFRECIDVMAHMNDLRHELDIYLLDWRIEAINFKPIEVGFTFDRENVFKILSDEIYNCHPYVYIRELIQNSIDAISLRKSILERKGIGGDNLGLIRLEVRKITDEEIEVTCCDDGVGMDEYILKNYFAIIGKSYYNSTDFGNKGIDMSPISRFGVGILSCFAVANSMEIITRREPYMDEGKQGLKVIIEDMKKTFRVEEIPDYKCEVGTLIKLKIKQESLEKQLENNNKFPDVYSIVNYIKCINKYIEYPVVVDEFGEKNVFLPTNYKQEILERKLSDIADFEIYNVEPEYPKEELVIEQDKENFDRLFDIRKIDITSDLGVSEIEGKMFFAVLRSEQTCVKGVLGNHSKIEILADNKMRIRWEDVCFGNQSKKGFFDYDFIAMCNKGILIEGNSSNREHFIFNSKLFPPPFISINFPNTISNISLSRFDCKSRKEVIEKLWDRLHDFMSSELLERKKSLSGYEFWRTIALYVLQYRLNIDKMNPALFEGVKYPFMNEEGAIAYYDIHDMQEIKLIPSIMKNVVHQYVKTGICEKDANWTYGRCLLSTNESYYTGYDFEGAINSIIYESLQYNFYFKELRFVRESNSEYLLKQEVWERGFEKDYIVKQISEILNEFNVSYERDGGKIKEIYNRLFHFEDLANFSEEYRGNFAYCFTTINLNHKKAQLLIKYIWCLNDMLHNKDMSKCAIGRKKDQIEELPFLRTGNHIGYKKYSFAQINTMLEELHNWLRDFYPVLGDDCVNFCKEDFVEHSISVIKDDCFYENRKYSL